MTGQRCIADARKDLDTTNHAGPSAGGTEATLTHSDIHNTEPSRSAKRKRNPEEDVEERPARLLAIDKGKGRDVGSVCTTVTPSLLYRNLILPTQDDDLWAPFPSSQIREPISTQPSFEFSETGSRNTSMTSLSSASSDKRKPAEPETEMPTLREEMTKSIGITSAKTRLGGFARTTS